MTTARFKRTAVAVIIVLGVAVLPQAVLAVQFQEAYLRLDRMTTSQATGGTICARPSTANLAQTEASVVITFPTTYTLNETESNWSVTTTNLPAGTTAWPSIAAPSGASDADNTAKTVKFVSGNLTSDSTTYCFNFSGTNTLTTPGTTANNQQASIQTNTSAPAEIDKTNIALTTVTNDQITVTAIVPPTFIFTLNGNSDSFSGNLDPASIMSTSGRTVTVTTNAKGGWIAWAKDVNAGLRSATANYTIPSTDGTPGTPTRLTAGTEGFYLDVDETTDAGGGCTVDADAEYDGRTPQNDEGGSLYTTFKPIASCTGAAPATANGDVITLTERVAISGATPAGSDYSDTITVVGAGNF